MKIKDLPVHLGAADDEGLNNVLNAIVYDEESGRDFAALLEKNPRALIRRTVRLNRYQNASLREMTDEKLRSLLQPVVDGLRKPEVLKMNLHIEEHITTQSPMSVSCTITVRW